MGIQHSVTRTVGARRRGPIPCLSHFRWRRTVRPARRYPQCCGGLLPDSETLLQRWASRFHVSARNPVALLSHVGEDCAGAVQFVRSERLAAVLSGESDRQEPLSTHEIAQRLQRVRVDQAAARRLDDVGQFSLAGAQAKIALLQRDDGGSSAARMRTRELATGFEHRTLQAHCTSLLFTTMAGLGALSQRSKEYLREPTTRAKFHPVVVSFGAKLEIKCGHLGSLSTG